MRAIESTVFPIHPADIDASQHLWNCFDHAETEVSAGWIVRFCQERGSGWEPFAVADLEAFYARKHADGFTFNKLPHRGWVWLRDGLCILSDEFVTRCFVASPAAVTADTARRWSSHPRFYIASDDPGAHGNPGLVLYRTLNQEEQKIADSGGHVEQWSIWLTEDVLAVAEASGLLDEASGTSAASARKWLQEDAKADEIRKQIAYLQGELARLSGEWLSVWTGALGYDRSHADLPPGGCLVDWSTGIRDQAWQRWHPSLDSGKAALLAQFQETGGDLSEDGLNLRDTGPAGGCTMRITRR